MDAWADLAPEAEADRAEQQAGAEYADVETVEMEDLPDLEQLPTSTSHAVSSRTSVEMQISTIPQTVAFELMRTMNIRQRQLFTYIRKWCMQIAQGYKVDPFHIFITGGAGTGKSHIIRALLYEATKLLRPTCPKPDDITVLLVAPTGTAAFNVGGRTIHSAFSIPATGMSHKYIPLGDDLITTLRAKYEHLQLVIIDEISMVSKRMLNYVSGRLDQIKRNSSSAWIGGCECISCGGILSGATYWREAAS